MDIKVGFIGGGTMGKALGFSMLKKKLLCPSNIYVSGPNIKNLEPWKSVGVTQLIDNNYDLVKYCQIIFICVEPHVFEVMANDFKKDYIDKPMTLAHIVWVSIMSGVSLNILKSELGFYSNAKIIRTLPNLAVAVGHGALVYAPGEHVTKDEMDKVKSLLEPIASCFQLPEGLLNAAGAVSGSGPAFAFMVIEALADGAVKMGVERDLAIHLSAHALHGAAEMVLSMGQHPSVLKDDVCNVGGATIAGIHELEKTAIRAALINAVEAVKLRSDQMIQKNAESDDKPKNICK